MVMVRNPRGGSNAPGFRLHCNALDVTLRFYNVSSLGRYMPRSKTATLNLRVQPDIKRAAEHAAADDRRSLTALIEKLLIDYLRKGGYLVEQALAAQPKRKR